MSLSFAFTFSICEALRIFLASSTVISLPVTVPGADNGRKLRSPRLKWSPVPVTLLIPLSFSLSFSPTGSDRKSGSFAVSEWCTDLRGRNRRKTPRLMESGEERYSRWKLVLVMFGETMVCWRDGVVLTPSKRRFVKSFLRAIDKNEDARVKYYWRDFKDSWDFEEGFVHLYIRPMYEEDFFFSFFI